MHLVFVRMKEIVNLATFECWLVNVSARDSLDADFATCFLVHYKFCQLRIFFTEMSFVLLVSPLS